MLCVPPHQNITAILSYLPDNELCQI